MFLRDFELESEGGGVQVGGVGAHRVTRELLGGGGAAVHEPGFKISHFSWGVTSTNEDKSKNFDQQLVDQSHL